MNKKSNKNSIKINREKKLVHNKSKRSTTQKSVIRKHSMGKKITKAAMAESWNLKPSNAELMARSTNTFERMKSTLSKVTPTPTEPVCKMLQPLSGAMKQKSNTVLKAPNNVPGSGKSQTAASAMSPQTTTPNINNANMIKAKSDGISYHVTQKPCNSLQDDQQSRDTNKIVIAPISFAKPYPYPLEPSFNYQLYKEFKQVADVAMRFRKTFMIYGAFPAVRRSLKNRGWVEKFPFNVHEALMKLTINELLRKMESNEAQKDLCETVIITKMLGTRKPDFIWNNSTHAKDSHTFDACQILSRMRHEPQGNFTQKYGLNRCLQDYTWHYIPGEAEIKFPRCYNTAIKDQMITFEEDFLLTACVSLLAYLQTKSPEELVSETGKIGYDTIEFALAHCNRFLYKSRHLDIDDPIYDDDEDPKDKLTKEDINDFLYCYYQIVQHEKTFELDDNNVLEGLRAESSKIYNSIKNMFPQHFIDGYCNMWLLKPGNQSRGRGILVLQKLDEIQDEIKKAPRKYVVQKYIERPLLIYGTKFDIRQYFLLTGTCPLTVWMYQDCYLRFSSRIYDLKNFHQAIHLTNNAIQSHYKNEESRHTNLPRENMWHSSTFQQYLADNGCPNAWSKLIYPGMRRCIVGTLLAAQEFLDRRNNSFELYGCDFLISEDFTPWLIEINSGPAMSASTSITAKLCPQALEDVIKVVIDYTRNWRAPTGRFELIYRQYLPSTDIPVKDEFLVEGKTLPEKYFHNFTYNEMLKVPSFSHLLRNQPRREINEYNELLPYVKEKLLRNKNITIDLSSFQNDKKNESNKKKKVKSHKEKEIPEKKMACKKPSANDGQATPKYVDPVNMSDLPDDKDPTKCVSSTSKRSAPQEISKAPAPKKIKVGHKNRRANSDPPPVKAGSNIDLHETNAKEDLKAKQELLINVTEPDPMSKKDTNLPSGDIKTKPKRTIKNENSEQETKNNENQIENYTIEEQKGLIDAAVTNKPVQISSKTVSNETTIPQQKAEKPIRTKVINKKQEQQKLATAIKIPPTIKALKSLQ